MILDWCSDQIWERVESVKARKFIGEHRRHKGLMQVLTSRLLQLAIGIVKDILNINVAQTFY
jgi:hypothetical protein